MIIIKLIIIAILFSSFLSNRRSIEDRKCKERKLTKNNAINIWQFRIQNVPEVLSIFIEGVYYQDFLYMLYSSLTLYIKKNLETIFFLTSFLYHFLNFLNASWIKLIKTTLNLRYEKCKFYLIVTIIIYLYRNTKDVVGPATTNWFLSSTHGEDFGRQQQFLIFSTSFVVVYHVTIVAMDMGCWRNVGLGNKLRSTHCSKFPYLKLCRPAYFVLLLFTM